jgi:hypothetical protein
MSDAATAALYEPFVCLWQMHELYYLHVGTSKQAKRNPQELVRQADESMQALVQSLQFCFDPKANCLPKEELDMSSSAASSSNKDTRVAAVALTTTASFETTDSACLDASSFLLANEVVVVLEVEPAADCKEKKKKKSDESSGGSSSNRETMGVVAWVVAIVPCFSCYHSSPLCPS